MPDSVTMIGSVVLGTKKWFAEHQTPEEFETFVKEFPESEKDYWTKPIVIPVSKIPGSVYANMHKAITKMWGEEMFRKISGAVAFNDLGTFMRFFIKLGTPAFTANAFATAYKQYFHTGGIQMLEKSSQAIVFELVGGEGYGQASCSGVLGWTRTALEYAGAKKLVTEHSECKFKGKSRCVFRYSWQ